MYINSAKAIHFFNQSFKYKIVLNFRCVLLRIGKKIYFHIRDQSLKQANNFFHA